MSLYLRTWSEYVEYFNWRISGTDIYLLRWENSTAFLKHALIEEIDIGLMYYDITCIFRDETTLKNVFMTIWWFLDHLGKGHVSFWHQLASTVCRKISHFNVLLWNQWIKLNQTWLEWSLGDVLSKS